MTGTPTVDDPNLTAAPAVPDLDRRQASSTNTTGGRRWTDDPDLKAAVERLQVGLSAMMFELRQRAGWSHRRLAAAAGVNVQTIAYIEGGRIDPQVSTLVRIFYALGAELPIQPRPVPRRGLTQANPRRPART